LPHEQIPYKLHSVSVVYADVLVPCQANKQIVSDYTSDSITILDYNSDFSYEFDFGLDLIEPESEYDSTEKP
jgi:hypothetical protein